MVLLYSDFYLSSFVVVCLFAWFELAVCLFVFKTWFLYCVSLAILELKTHCRTGQSQIHRDPCVTACASSVGINWICHHTQK